jgi:homocysteine S-methyltransferase
MAIAFDPTTPRILDGGLATELERRGFSLDDPLWSARALIDQPEAIERIHCDYLAAGAGCITSASYQASFEGFAVRGMNPRQAELLMRESVRIALRARDRFLHGTASSDVDSPAVGDRPVQAPSPKPLVAASIGPYGAIRHDGSEFHGDYGLSQKDLSTFHESRMNVLADCGADLLACETIPSLLEARALVETLRQHPDATAWISFSCKDGEHTCAGDPIADCAAFLDRAPGVFAVGVNCTAPRHIESLVRRIRQTTAKTIVVYPNSGETWNYERQCWEGSSDVGAFVRLADQWRIAGASWIGGCCRTTPQHIRRLRALTS